MLALILLVLAGSTLGNYNYQSCNLWDLNKCQQQFNKHLKINESLGVKTYQDLRKAIETTLGTEKAYGLANTCAAFNDYKQCLRNIDVYNYESCVSNPLGLLIGTNGTATGITREEAFGYTKIFTQFIFTCGAGYEEFNNNEECASTVFLDGIQEMRNCDEALDRDSKLDPANACSYLNAAIECYKDVFRKKCPKFYEVIWFGCNYERIGAQINFPQCTQSFCTYYDVRK